jgi:hypothetical protein
VGTPKPRTMEMLEAVTHVLSLNCVTDGLRPLLIEGWVTQARSVVVTSTASSKDSCLGCGLRKGTQGYARRRTQPHHHHVTHTT